MDSAQLLSLRARDAAQVRDLIEADPTLLLSIGAAIANGRGEPAAGLVDVVRDLREVAARIEPARFKRELEACLMGRDVDLGLEWLHQVGVLAAWFPELEATVNLTQESDRMHKDVWAHTKQVVKQAVRRPDVRWAALLHDIGKVPTRTFTDKGVHFHGHAEVGARMFDKVVQRVPFDRDQRRTVRFLIKHHLRSNQYSDAWSDSAVRRFTREMGLYSGDLLDLSRADITSKRPGRRKQLLEQIHALSVRMAKLAEEDAKLPPLPTGVGTAIMEAFALPPSKRIGDLKQALEAAVMAGQLEARREDGYYVAWLARSAMLNDVPAERLAAVAAAGGELGLEPPDGDEEEPERDPDAPSLACGDDPEGHSH